MASPEVLTPFLDGPVSRQITSTLMGRADWVLPAVLVELRLLD